MADWATISALATATGTLVLAAATFAAVRPAHDSARITERALMAGIRPVLVPSRLQDPPEKIGFADNHWLKVDAGFAVADVTPDVISRFALTPLDDGRWMTSVSRHWNLGAPLPHRGSRLRAG